ncbi:probable caffeoyl-CoA O-methyltransferase 1 isoform X2 [Mytilus edulis]
MADKISYDPALTKLWEVKREAEKLGLPESIISGLQAVEDLFEAREVYCDGKTSEPSDALSKLMKDTMEHPWQQLFNEGKTKWNISTRMLSGNLEGYVLKFLVSASKAKRVLEVGMFTGCGALGMAEVMPDDGKVVTCEFDPYLVKLTRTFVDKSPHGKKITIVEGPALNSLNDLGKKGEKFDFIFIDADKPGYCDYFNVSIKDLLAPGGTIALDNALHYGKPYLKECPDDEPIKRFNDMLMTRNDVYHVLMPVRDGIMLVRRKEDMNG